MTQYLLNSRGSLRLQLYLTALLFLFALRVAGQLAVALGHAPYLPPLEAWYSGLLPYPPLLLSQLIILALGLFIIRGVRTGTGWFGRKNRGLGRALVVFGRLYLISMILRYILTMTLRPDMRWTGHAIPITFHILLALFILTFARHHRESEP